MTGLWSDGMAKNRCGSRDFRFLAALIPSQKYRLSSKQPRRMVLITIHRKPLESLAVFVFSLAKFSLVFHVYKMSAVGIRTLDGTI